MSLLKILDSPTHLKRLSPGQFLALFQEIREQIISVTSAAGGHPGGRSGFIRCGSTG